MVCVQLSPDVPVAVEQGLGGNGEKSPFPSFLSFPQCFHGITVPAGSGHDWLMCYNICIWVIIYAEFDGCVLFVWEEITFITKVSILFSHAGHFFSYLFRFLRV